jgi:hypothetical protein
MILSGFVRIGDLAPQAFGTTLAQAWSAEAVRLEPFCEQSTEASIRSFGARWQSDQPTAPTSFRSMRLTVGPRWAKATRHWSPSASKPYLEPMPVSIGYDGEW